MRLTTSLSGLLQGGVLAVAGLGAIAAPGCSREPAQLSVSVTHAYPYSESLLENYARLEEGVIRELGITELTPRTREALSLGDRVSNAVATRALDAAKKPTLEEAIAATEPVSLMRWTAQALAKEGVFYHGESLLSFAFDPQLHQPGEATLDCDLIAYVFSHVGKRLDLPIFAVSGPSHAYLYLQTTPSEGIVIEPTEFRRIEVNDVAVNYGGQGVGEGFFSTFERQKEHGGLVATDEFIQKAGLHTPLKDERLIRESMLVNILSGIQDFAESEGDTDLQLKVHALLYDKLRKEGPHTYLLVNNTHSQAVHYAYQQIEQGMYGKAEEMLKRASYAWDQFKELIISDEPAHQTARARLLHKQGKTRDARDEFRSVSAYYERCGGLLKDRSGSLFARTPEHAKFLLFQAEFELETGGSPRRAYNEMLVPALNQWSQYDDARELPEFQRTEALMRKIEGK